jgi:uncharacterized Zn ribbon protein
MFESAIFPNRLGVFSMKCVKCSQNYKSLDKDFSFCPSCDLEYLEDAYATTHVCKPSICDCHKTIERMT